jgi:RNA-directed DNA polymerase
VKFFDRFEHEQLGVILRRRVRDGVLLRLIGKGVKAGVLEAGEVTYPEAGSLNRAWPSLTVEAVRFSQSS